METREKFKSLPLSRVYPVILLVIFLLFAVEGFINGVLKWELSFQQSNFIYRLILYTAILLWMSRIIKYSGLKLKFLIGSYRGQIAPGKIIVLGTGLTIVSGITFSLYLKFIGLFFPDLAANLGQLAVVDLLNNDYLFFGLNRLILVLIVPWVEEIIFRGFLLHKWALKYGLNRALLFSSLLFAFLHLNFPGSFFFGIIAAILYIREGTLLIPIFLHIIYNGLWTVSLYLKKVNIDLGKYLFLEFCPVYVNITFHLFLMGCFGYFIYKNLFRLQERLPYLANREWWEVRNTG